MPFYQPSINQFNTPLSGDDEVKYQVWKSINEPNDPGADYDYRGAWKAGIQRSLDPTSGEMHYPDTYKKPTHETFSDESIYSSLTGTKPGHWKGDKYMPFERPEPTNQLQVNFRKNAGAILDDDPINHLDMMLQKTGTQDTNAAQQNIQKTLQEGPFAEAANRQKHYFPAPVQQGIDALKQGSQDIMNAIGSGMQKGKEFLDTLGGKQVSEVSGGEVRSPFTKGDQHSPLASVDTSHMGAVGKAAFGGYSSTKRPTLGG